MSLKFEWQTRLANQDAQRRHTFRPHFRFNQNNLLSVINEQITCIHRTFCEKPKAYVSFLQWCKEQPTIATLCSKAVEILNWWQHLPDFAKAPAFLVKSLSMFTQFRSSVSFALDAIATPLWKLFTLLTCCCYNNWSLSPFTRLTSYPLADDSSRQACALETYKWHFSCQHVWPLHDCTRAVKFVV